MSSYLKGEIVRFIHKQKRKETHGDFQTSLRTYLHLLYDTDACAKHAQKFDDQPQDPFDPEQ